MINEANEWAAQFKRTSGRVATITPHPKRKGFFLVSTRGDMPADTWSRKKFAEAAKKLALRKDFL